MISLWNREKSSLEDMTREDDVKSVGFVDRAEAVERRERENLPMRRLGSHETV